MNVSRRRRVAMVQRVAIQMAPITVSAQRAMRAVTVLSTQMTALHFRVRMVEHVLMGLVTTHAFVWMDLVANTVR